MRIKHFIVTYNNEKRLNSTLESLFSSQSDLSSLEVYVINNHSNISVREEFGSRIKILNNQTRPDFSTGHLSRNWNQAIINGFKDLSNPDCDLLIMSQDDTLFEKNYLEKSVELSKSLDFVCYGTGDQYMIYTPKGVKRIGLWDERFCNIGFQEADYFLRAVRYHDKVSINDGHHGREYLTRRDMTPILPTASGFHAGDSSHLKSMVFHAHSGHVFTTKWKVRPQWWDLNHINILKSIDPNMMSYIMYPYFEKDVETLREQKYLVC